MTAISRRRFLVDLAFAGGALSLIAGIAYAGKEKPKSSAHSHQQSQPSSTRAVFGGQTHGPLPYKIDKIPWLKNDTEGYPNPP